MKHCVYRINGDYVTDAAQHYHKFVANGSPPSNWKLLYIKLNDLNWFGFTVVQQVQAEHDVRKQCILRDNQSLRQEMGDMSP